MIKIGLLGLGTVGSSFVKNFYNHEISKVAIIDKILLLDKNKKRNIDTSHFTLITDINEIIDDPNIDIIIELIGGEYPALNYIIAAIKNKKHVITANKCVMALHGDNLIELASDNNVTIAYEASVGGGIPIIRTLIDSLVSNRISRFIGICNGTSNYIISKMYSDKLDFNLALKQAQDLGYAEADADLDIEGFDASYKASILSNLCFRHFNNYNNIYIEGIKKVKLFELEQADRLGYRIKPIVYGKLENNKVQVAVFLALISKNNIIAHVDGVNNIIQIDSDIIGTTHYIGPGAGGDPTSSSIISDLINIIECPNSDKKHYNTSVNNFSYTKFESLKFKFFISLTINNNHSINTSIDNSYKIRFVNKINYLLAQQNINIITMYFVEHDLESIYSHIIILSDFMINTKIKNLSESFKKLDNIEDFNFIRLIE